MRARADTALTIWAVPVILVAGLITPSHAHVAHPWCTSGRVWAGGFSCAFDTYQRCLENARPYTANCVATPAIDPLPQVESRPAQPKRR